MIAELGVRGAVHAYRNAGNHDGGAEVPGERIACDSETFDGDHHHQQPARG
ncbi:hypothetical protein AB4Y81_05860 [Paenarthrobacter sp. TAF1]|uniref:hypothetical protein n=1 Tax=Paenarthrobacter sp. TAF1 TaxID=3233067 RepID=UPI003F94C2D1